MFNSNPTYLVLILPWHKIAWYFDSSASVHVSLEVASVVELIVFFRARQGIVALSERKER